MNIRAFDEALIEAAAALLSKRLGDDPQMALLGTDTSAEACAEHLTAKIAKGARGLAATDATGLQAYLLASEVDYHGPMMQIDLGCHSYRDDPDALRALYAELATGWLAAGFMHHWILVSPSDKAGLDAWLSMSFPMEAVEAGRKTEVVDVPSRDDYVLRLASADDLDAIGHLMPLIYDAHRVSPVFAYVTQTEYDELSPGHKELLEDATTGYWVAEAPEGLLGYAAMRPVRPDEATLLKPPGSVELIVAASAPAARGMGVMGSLTRKSLSWAKENGFDVCVTGWRTANLDSSRVWPHLGFVPTAYRLRRMVDPRVGGTATQS